MSIAEQVEDSELEGELLAVARAGGARLRAETDQDGEASRIAADELVKAASSAMAAGRTLTEIARAETSGKDRFRQELRSDALKLVERSGKRAREMQIEHYQAIARATRLGLPMREIAQAAGVTHGTIRAINNRLAGQAMEPDVQPPDQDHEAMPAPGEGHDATRPPHEGHEETQAPDAGHEPPQQW